MSKQGRKLLQSARNNHIKNSGLATSDPTHSQQQQLGDHPQRQQLIPPASQMVDLKAKIRAKFSRRQSGIGSLSAESSTGSSNAEGQRKPSLVSNSSDRIPGSHSSGVNHHRASGEFPMAESEKKKARSVISKGSSRDGSEARVFDILNDTVHEEDHSEQVESTRTRHLGEKSEIGANVGRDLGVGASDMSSSDLQPSSSSTRLPSIHEQSPTEAIEASDSTAAKNSIPLEAVSDQLVETASTINDDDGLVAISHRNDGASTAATPRLGAVIPATPTPTASPSGATTVRPPAPVARPSAPGRRQSLLPNRQSTLIRTLLDSEHAEGLELATSDQLLGLNAAMVTRKIWVKRPGASATLVTINEEDLVDDVRDMILRKYGNSLGRQFDSPDITLRIVPRENRMDRTLGPEEPMSRTLDAYYPGGQTVDEALIIDVPLGRRTPRASPRAGPPHATHLGSAYYDEIRPSDASTDYFGPTVQPSMPVTITAPVGAGHAPHTVAVMNSAQIPPLPSPGATNRSRNYRERPDRPRLGRTHTSSPTIIGLGAGHHSSLTGAAAGHNMHGT